MSSRFAFAPDWVQDLVDEVRREHFPGLANARILVLFDEKKRQSQGRYVLGRIQRAQDVVRLLSEHADGEAFDYVLGLDYEVFVRIERPDQVRLIRHELRHCWHDSEAEDNPYKLVGHDIEDFHAEVKLNADDPKWVQRLAEVAASIYESDTKPPIPDPRQGDLFNGGEAPADQAEPEA
ncbi:MAG: putative metallopeptidase [Pseudomonadota bacterium]